MPTDAGSADAAVKSGKIKERFYGFNPADDYIVRSRSRRYNATSQGYYRFVNGEVVALRMKGDATDEQRWNRGERLAWFTKSDILVQSRQGIHSMEPGYKVYKRGTEPAPDLEPMWAGQDIPEEAELPDSGESNSKWEAAPLRGEGSAEIATVMPVAPREDSGESVPKPKTTQVLR